jgi:hypothetical protein
MVDEPPTISARDFLRCVRERLDEAIAVAKAAEACADAGRPEHAIGIVRSIRYLVHDVSTFLDAANAINRPRHQ